MRTLRLPWTNLLRRVLLRRRAELAIRRRPFCRRSWSFILSITFELRCRNTRSDSLLTTLVIPRFRCTTRARTRTNLRSTLRASLLSLSRAIRSRTTFRPTWRLRTLRTLRSASFRIRVDLWAPSLATSRRTIRSLAGSSLIRRLLLDASLRARSFPCRALLRTPWRTMGRSLDLLCPKRIMPSRLIAPL